LIVGGVPVPGTKEAAFFDHSLWQGLRASLSSISSIAVDASNEDADNQQAKAWLAE
jgi:hypothetical protein